MNKMSRFFKVLIFISVIALAGCGSSNAQVDSVIEPESAVTSVVTEENLQVDIPENEDTEDLVTENTIEDEDVSTTETGDTSEEEKPEDTIHVSDEDSPTRPAVAENPEPAVVNPETAGNEIEDTPGVAAAELVTDLEEDVVPTGDIPATVTWTYTTLVANDPNDPFGGGHAETFTVTTRNPGLHTVEYYQAHPWKLYNEENTDELGTISFTGWDAGFPGDAWGSLYYDGYYICNITDDSYLYGFAIRNLDDYNAVSYYQFQHMNW